MTQLSEPIVDLVLINLGLIALGSWALYSILNLTVLDIIFGAAIFLLGYAIGSTL